MKARPRITRFNVFSNRDCVLRFACPVLVGIQHRKNQSLVPYPRSDLNNNQVGFRKMPVELI